MVFMYAYGVQVAVCYCDSLCTSCSPLHATSGIKTVWLNFLLTAVKVMQPLFNRVRVNPLVHITAC